MEALRKAEAAKRAGQQGDDSTAFPPTVEFPPADYSDEEFKEEESAVPDVFKYTSTDDFLALAPRQEPVADIPVYTPPAELPLLVTDDVLDDYLSDSPEMEPEELPPARPERERVKVQQQRERAAAASMFNAKAPPEEQTNKQRRMLILSGALVVVVLIVGGGWWYVLNFSGGTALVNPTVVNANLQTRGFLGDPPPGAANSTDQSQSVAAPAAAPISVVASAAATAEATGTSAGVPATNVSSSRDPQPAAVAIAESDQRDADLAVTDPQLDSVAPDDTDETPVQTSVDQDQPATASSQQPVTVTETQQTTQPATTLEFGRAASKNIIQPTLQTAYDKLVEGDVRAANELYQEVLSQFPNNRDALLGFASVQLKFDNRNGARNTYARLLQLNPQDALARTGMLQTLPVTDAAAYESELLALKQRFPTLAPLSFALGNHYASNGKWHEAQTEYFDALLQARREPGAGPNPDYAFNLAVSLEQLGQKAAALEYYKEAESLATRVKPGFDPMMLRQRLSELEQRQ